MKIGIYVYDNVEELDFIGPFEVFSYANKIKPNTFKIILFSHDAKEVKAYNGLRFIADRLINEISEKDLDVLIFPGGKGRLKEAKEKEIISFTKSAYPNLKLVASVCTGAFFLGEAGLLNNKKATTHKSAIKELQESYNVEILNERIVKNEKIWLSAGVSSGIDLALEIVKEFLGEDMMMQIKNGMEYKK